LLPGTYNLALDAATGTVYAANSGDPFASGNTVSVINGANCLGTMAGCGKVAAVVDLGAVPDVQGGPAGPDGIAVDDATHTLYVADNHNGDLPGRVTLVNTATCNGFVTTGCHDTFPTVVVGTSPRLAEYDEDTGLLYITNYSSTDVSVLATARCNAESQAGCPVQAPEVVVGSQPNGLAVRTARALRRRLAARARHGRATTEPPPVPRWGWGVAPAGTAEWVPLARHRRARPGLSTG
jgi:DNA-binding beta-propeller fold protein YncE